MKMKTYFKVFSCGAGDSDFHHVSSRTAFYFRILLRGIFFANNLCVFAHPKGHYRSEGKMHGKCDDKKLSNVI